MRMSHLKLDPGDLNVCNRELMRTPKLIQHPQSSIPAMGRGWANFSSLIQFK